MCRYIDNEYLMPGWGCCRCDAGTVDGDPVVIYNGLQRGACKNCGEQRCTSLQPDKETGRRFENRKFHR